MADDRRRQPTTADEGKDVVNLSGERLGTVTGVEGDRMYVEQIRGLTDQIKAALGWTDSEDVHRIPVEYIDRITENEVRVESTGAGEIRGTGTGDANPPAGSTEETAGVDEPATGDTGTAASGPDETGVGTGDADVGTAETGVETNEPAVGEDRPTSERSDEPSTGEMGTPGTGDETGPPPEETGAGRTAGADEERRDEESVIDVGEEEDDDRAGVRDEELRDEDDESDRS